METNTETGIISRRIRMTNITDLTEFVIKASQVVGDITVRKGIYVIDGKSLMGLMSIDVSSGAVVEYPEEATEFDAFIAPFEA